MNERLHGRATHADWLFWAAVAIGASHIWAVQQDLGGALVIAWKGAGAGLLALWAVANVRSRDGWMIAAVLGFGALGDVLIDAVGLVAGALAFIAGHIIAIQLYWRNRRDHMTPSQRLLGTLLAPGTVLISWLLVPEASAAVGVAVYAAFLGAMAAMAWTSRFSRYRVGIGTLLFVVSDWLIFARLGGRIDPDIARMLIWPLYFGGQALIARGVVTRL